MGEQKCIPELEWLRGIFSLSSLSFGYFLKMMQKCSMKFATLESR